MSFDKDFLKADFQSMVENLNRISDDLLKAKWYFLATIAAVGLAYLRILKLTESKNLFHYSFLILITSAVGNIVFWMIGEYIVSHGFLFRYIQTKVAKIENIAYKGEKNLEKLIRDPGKRSYYITNCFLSADYILPDQFLPLYLASFWLIILNTAVAISLYSHKSTLSLTVFILVCFSLFLIWKLLSYHLYKIRQFLSRTVYLKLVPACAKEKDFFHFPFSVFYGLLPAGILSYLNWLLEIKAFPWYYWLILPVFWPVGLAIAAHLHRILDTLLDKERKLPVKREVNKYVVQIDRKIAWAYWLLYFIV